MPTLEPLDKTILEEFSAEITEVVNGLERNLLEWEAHPEQGMQALLRGFHAIKGTSGFLGLEDMETLAHLSESVLGSLDENSDRQPVVSALLHTLDAFRAGLEDLAAGGEDKIDAIWHAELELKSLLQSSTPHARPQMGETSVVTVDKTVRVKVAILERLLRLAEQLEIKHQHLASVRMIQEEPVLSEILQRMQLDLSDLVKCAQHAHSQPLMVLWSCFPRYVRDLSQSLGKPVRMELKGAELEVDKQLLDGLRAALIQMMRNSIDHGIETPDRRKTLNKPSEGAIVLEAEVKTDQLKISLKDDGGGINRDSLLNAARKHLPENELSALKEIEIDQLIFFPGISTANNTNKLSGRGMGMSVIKTAIESLGGTITVLNQPGHGTEFLLSFPASKVRNI